MEAQRDPIPIKVHLFVKEIRKYSCPLAVMSVSLDEDAKLVRIILTGNASGKSFESRAEYPFFFIDSWPYTKALDMAYTIALDLYIKCVKGCLIASRKGK